MDFEFSEDQRAVHDAIAQIVSGHMEQPRVDGAVVPSRFVYGERLDAELERGGFFELSRMEGYRALDAVWLIYEVSQSPMVVEVATSALIAPMLLKDDLPRPIAVARFADLRRGVRFLDRAKTLIVDCEDGVRIVPRGSIDVVPVETMFAYPIGRLEDPQSVLDHPLSVDVDVSEFRRLWRIGLSAEIAGALNAATTFTTQFVKDRSVFSRPVGSFQAVQHRLSENIQVSRAAYWLALKAADSARPSDALAAAAYSQSCITEVVYDAHQFNGAVGMTYEHLLHFWTFRLRHLIGELGGANVAALDLANELWA